MRFRKLRIAWSIAWGILCLFLIALWVRSYTWDDLLGFPCPATRGVEINSLKGRVLATVYETSNTILLRGVDLRCIPDTNYLLWFLVTLSAAIAAVPWLPTRFSLRTLLIASTLAAVATAFVAWTTT
jgi:hypothetical protein